MSARYGYFDDGRLEYVITEPRTPVKWINYLGTLAFGGFVDHTGGALICKGDPALNRITRYDAGRPSGEFRGTTLYLRFRREDGYQVLSPYYVPSLAPYQRYECHVGLGYNRIVSEFHGLRTDALLFVPRERACLLSDIQITNVGDRPLEVDAIPAVEYTHFNALLQLTNADWVPQTMQSCAHEDEGGQKVLLQYAFMRRGAAVNYLTSDLPASSFETDRARFLGDHEYGTWAQPLSLRQAELSNTQARRGDNVAALLHHLGLMLPGETRRLIVQLGQAESLEAAMPTIRAYRSAARVEAASAELARFWRDYLSTVRVSTPDADMDRMLNIHNPRQCYVTKQWSRYLSLYQLGFGARGIGFRDSAQDLLGIMAHVPGEGRQLIEQLLHVQRRDGSAMHQFNPLTMVATEGDSLEMPDRPHYYSDDHLWIILAVAAYLKETGDIAFLSKVIPYYEKGPDGRPLEAGTVLEHMQRAVEFTRQDVGAHGLPLLGFADWNDTVNLEAGAESMFTANLYGLVLLEMIELARHLGEGRRGSHEGCPYEGLYEEVKARFNEHAWDGGWYVSYFDAAGRPLGSRANAHGQIHANGQTWPVLSGFAPPDRARLALDALHARLNTRDGIKLSAPGYDGYDPQVGGISTYPPGAKENGGVFLHANTWAILAEARLGNGDLAYQYYAQINPASRNDRIGEFECEPYVYPQNILGDEHPQCGLARNSWLTGTAAWAYWAATQAILGVQPTYGGLRIDPCIPAAWDGFSVRRAFRGAVYEIQVRNPYHVCKGVRSLRVDGRVLQGNLVPLLDADLPHLIEAELVGSEPQSLGRTACLNQE